MIKKTLFLVDKIDEYVVLSAKNLPKVKIMLASKLNTYDVLNANCLVFNEASLPIIENILLRFQKA